MAVRRLGWGAATPEWVYVSDRVRRCAEEEAARALRLALHRRAVLAAITATWPADPGRRTDAEWTAVRAALDTAVGGGVSTALIRNRTRQLRAYLDERGLSPADLTDQADQLRQVDVVEVEGPPLVAAQVLLAAADRQLVTLKRGGTDARLRVQLPLSARPATRRDWAWHTLPVPLPAHLPADASLRSPTLRVVDGRVRVDLPFTTAVRHAPATGHTVAVGFDWGVTTLLTGTFGRLHDGQVEGDGRPLLYDATTISAKLHRLRGHREALAAKAGLAVVTVPARGTSKYCPRCGTGTAPLHHAPAPDRLNQRGCKWARCSHCGLSCDRDQAAAERIVSRGLLAQHHTHTDRTTGTRTIRTVVEGNLARARRLRKPTRAARRARRTRTDLHPRPPTRARQDRAKPGPTPKRPTRQRPTPSDPLSDPPRRLSASCPTGVWCPPPP
jgi:hypothetical protein